MALKDLKGLGPKRLQILREQGIEDERDLLYWLPSGYIDSTAPLPVNMLRPGQTACLELTLSAVPKIQYMRGFSIVRAQAQDDSGGIHLIWFNQPWNKQLAKGEALLVYGRAEMYKGQLGIQNPKILKERGIHPQYRPIGSVAGKVIQGYIAQLLPDIGRYCPETMPDRLLSLWRLSSLREALSGAHQASSAEALASAKRRIAFENLLLYQLALRQLQGGQSRGFEAKASPELIPTFWKQAGFRPTAAQSRVLAEILADLSTGRAMRRLVQGDVGSGKTAIAFAAAAAMVQSGCQCALMAPTEILARQHLHSAQRMLEPLGIRCGLLVGGMRAEERRQMLQGIASGDCQMVIGTHALLSEGVRYANLGLVITDEQHRFGVRQRQRLSDKAQGERTPHVLVMSATPIPRTLALILYGDLELSVVDELPPGRKPVRTRIVPEYKRAGLYAFIRERTALGEQAYLVCPLVEESERVEAKDAIAMHRELANGPLKGLRLGLSYGSQPSDEKEQVIHSFSNGELDVLVSTTVIEVGVDVPKASVMVIENAERFGLSQLHQLRGRVGRGSAESWCFLMGEPNERLRTLCATNDGFVIAQKDLELRGPGDFLGTRQHGRLLPDAYGVGDMRLVEETRDAAKQLVEDASLKEAGQQLLELAGRRYSEIISGIALH